jgi:hypothetical protein
MSRAADFGAFAQADALSCARAGASATHVTIIARNGTRMRVNGIAMEHSYSVTGCSASVLRGCLLSQSR